MIFSVSTNSLDDLVVTFLCKLLMVRNWNCISTLHNNVRTYPCTEYVLSAIRRSGQAKTQEKAESRKAPVLPVADSPCGWIGPCHRKASPLWCSQYASNTVPTHLSSKVGIPSSHILLPSTLILGPPLCPVAACLLHLEATHPNAVAAMSQSTIAIFPAFSRLH